MKDDANSLIRPGPPPRHRGSFGSLPRIAKRGGATQTNETFRAPAAPFGTYALLTASSLSLLSSCAQLQPSRPSKVASKPSPKPKPALYQWQGNGHKVSHIEVDLDKQKAFFYAGPDKIGWARVAAGVRSTPTPVGKFKITEKVAKKRSNRYGKIYHSKGNLVIRNAATKIDTIPRGGRFEGAPMPYFMRLTNGGVGFHGGPIPRVGRPASHGCIRLPRKFASILYQHTAVGTPVRIFGGPSDPKYSGTWAKKQGKWWSGVATPTIVGDSSNADNAPDYGNQCSCGG